MEYFALCCADVSHPNLPSIPDASHKETVKRKVEEDQPVTAAKSFHSQTLQDCMKSIMSSIMNLLVFESK